MNALISRPLKPDNEARVIQQLTALAQSSRLTIFRELVKVFDSANDQHGLAAGEIAARMQLPAATLSFHLKEMVRADLLSSERIGRSVIYRANLSSIRALIDFLLEDCCSDCC
jgi:DNA-binding transcriptional ArsR family regulator